MKKHKAPVSPSVQNQTHTSNRPPLYPLCLSFLINPVFFFFWFFFWPSCGCITLCIFYIFVLVPVYACYGFFTHSLWGAPAAVSVSLTLPCSFSENVLSLMCVAQICKGVKVIHPCPSFDMEQAPATVTVTGYMVSTNKIHKNVYVISFIC